MQPDSSASNPLLEQRLVELETRLAFQEQAIFELNQALSDARLEGARNQELLRHLLEDLGKLRSGLYGGAAQDEPPPPHY